MPNKNYVTSYLSTDEPNRLTCHDDDGISIARFALSPDGSLLVEIFGPGGHSTCRLAPADVAELTEILWKSDDDQRAKGG